MDAVEIDVSPDLGGSLFICKTVAFEIPDQAVAETLVFGRHRIEHGPVAVGADQELVAFRKVFQIISKIVHGKLRRKVVRKDSLHSGCSDDGTDTPENIRAESRKIKPDSIGFAGKAMVADRKMREK